MFLNSPVWGNSSFPSQKPDTLAAASFGSSSLLTQQHFFCVWYSECRWSYPQQWTHRQAGENNDKQSRHISSEKSTLCSITTIHYNVLTTLKSPKLIFFQLLSNCVCCIGLTENSNLQPNPDWGLRRRSQSCGPLCSLPCYKPWRAWKTNVGGVRQNTVCSFSSRITQ